MSEATVKVTDASFKSEVIDSATPVIVDFWAPWCGPCRMIAPVLDELAVEYGGKVKIAKYNVDENNQYAVEHGIRGIPALLIFRNGQVAETIVGAVPKSAIVGKLETVLGA